MQCTQGLFKGQGPGSGPYPGRVATPPGRVHRAIFSWQGTHVPRRADGHRPRQLAVVKLGDDQALARMASLANKSILDEAARRLKAGLELGLDEDYLVARELGATDLVSLTDMQIQYKDKIKDKLFQRLQEIRSEEEAMRKKLAKNFELGKEAYGCGEYQASVKLLETSIEELDPNSQLGGEAQLWLALAYQACGREQDCIDLYKQIENNHPSPRMRKQAGDLRYIMEAPKLTIGKDERVTIPLIETDTWRAKERKTSYGPSRILNPPAAKKVKSSYWDNTTWDINKDFVPDKWYVRVAWALLLTGLTVYGWWQANGPTGA